MGLKAARRDHRRVRPARLNELNDDQKRNQSNHDPFNRYTFHRRDSPQILQSKSPNTLARILSR